ncbi:MAG: hypothetical protein KDE35_15455 [Geminicoccaceae bacterium]|nr:hypothetical protein [Geminicoccaceae bacterium]
MASMTRFEPAVDTGGRVHPVSKIAEVTLAFWILKIIATTLGEMSGDFIAHTMNLGYVVGLSITSTLLLIVLTLQIRADRFHPALFWAAIVATTTAGTEVSDLMDRTLGLGYVAGSVILATGLLATLAVWYYRDRDLSVDPIIEKDAEIMFWIAVVFSNSLGTAFGDALVDVVGFSYVQGAFVTAGIIAVVLLLHYATKVDKTVLFWIAFIFTRPFGATFGDFLTKPLASGGLDLGTLQASFVALALLATVLFASGRLATTR